MAFRFGVFNTSMTFDHALNNKRKVNK